MGRFLNEDTYEGQIDNPLSLNLYTYVINNPLIYTDPTGNMHEMGGESGSAGGGGAYTVPKILLKGNIKVKVQSTTVRSKNVKASMDSSNSSNKLRAEVNSQRNSTKGSGNSSRYSGNLEKVNKPDATADALTERIDGQSRVKFSSDPANREFDFISDQYIAQSKPALQTVNKSVRDQMKATFEAAQETGRKVYYHFEGQPAQSVIEKLNEYSSRYGIKVIIDTKSLK